jgi:hypothetical protein
MKVYINRKPINGPWGGGNMWVKAAYELLPYFGIRLVELNEMPDVILIVGLNRDNECISAIDAINYKNMRRRNGNDVKVIMRVNENDARKGTNYLDSSIKELMLRVDNVVFVSKWLKTYFSIDDLTIKDSIICNGVDTSIFKSASKINNNKVNIVTHHWSDNILKGFDIYDEIDSWISNHSDFTFTYIGRDRGTFKNTKIISPLFGPKLGAELAKYDVYISASRYDPGPNHIIESIACKIPTYVHIDGGGCVEFAGTDHTYSNINEILNILSNKQYIENTQWMPNDWHTCIKQFAEIITA